MTCLVSTLTGWLSKRSVTHVPVDITLFESFSSIFARKEYKRRENIVNHS